MSLCERALFCVGATARKEERVMFVKCIVCDQYRNQCSPRVSAIGVHFYQLAFWAQMLWSDIALEDVCGI